MGTLSCSQRNLIQITTKKENIHYQNSRKHSSGSKFLTNSITLPRVKLPRVFVFCHGGMCEKIIQLHNFSQNLDITSKKNPFFYLK